MPIHMPRMEYDDSVAQTVTLTWPNGMAVVLTESSIIGIEPNGSPWKITLPDGLLKIDCEKLK